MAQRGGFEGGGSEHEGSRRMKTELLIQMDGLNKSDALVFVLAASNIPWVGYATGLLDPHSHHTHAHDD